MAWIDKADKNAQQMIEIPWEHLADGCMVRRDEGGTRDFVPVKLRGSLQAIDWEKVGEEARKCAPDNFDQTSALLSKATFSSSTFLHDAPPFPEVLEQGFATLSRLNEEAPRNADGSLKGGGAPKRFSTDEWKTLLEADKAFGEVVLSACANQIKNLAEVLKRSRTGDAQEELGAKAAEYACFFNEKESFGFNRENPFATLQAVNNRKHDEWLYEGSEEEGESASVANVSTPEELKQRISDATQRWDALAATITPLFQDARSSYNSYLSTGNNVSKEAEKFDRIIDCVHSLDKLAQKESWTKKDCREAANIADSLLDNSGSFSTTLCLSIGDIVGKYYDCSAHNLPQAEYDATLKLAEAVQAVPEYAKEAFALATQFRTEVAYPAIAHANPKKSKEV